MQKEYSFKQGFRSNLDAEIVGATIEQLSVTHGSVTADLLVEEAKHSDSPLHHYFIWDDSEAAKKYREDQARLLIRNVEVRIIQNNQSTEPIKAFINVKSQYDGYKPIQKVMENKNLKTLFIKQAYDELMLWRDRYIQYAEFGEVIKVIDTLKIA